MPAKQLDPKVLENLELACRDRHEDVHVVVRAGDLRAAVDLIRQFELLLDSKLLRSALTLREQISYDEALRDLCLDYGNVSR